MDIKPSVGSINNHSESALNQFTGITQIERQEHPLEFNIYMIYPLLMLIVEVVYLQDVKCPDQGSTDTTVCDLTSNPVCCIYSDPEFFKSAPNVCTACTMLGCEMYRQGSCNNELVPYCTEPRPKLEDCPTTLKLVCGEQYPDDFERFPWMSVSSYTNACVACADPSIWRYSKGQCPWMA